MAEVEEARAFGARRQAEAQRLGVSAAALSISGGGAGWVWNSAGERLAGAAQVLDVYRGAEHPAAEPPPGEGPALEHRLGAARQRLVGDGYWGVCEVLAEPLAGAGQQRQLAAGAAAALNYSCGHRERLGYAVRLRRGQAIGSGVAEGAIEQRVSVRLKRAGARWPAEQVGPFVRIDGAGRQQRVE